MGVTVHSSHKNYYFGLSSLIGAGVAAVLMVPKFYMPWKFGTNDYPLDSQKLLFSIIVGVFGWASQEALTLSLRSVKSGTVASFQNMSIFFAFMVDILHSKRVAIWPEYTGSSMIIIFTIMQGIFSYMKYKEDNPKKEIPD